MKLWTLHPGCSSCFLSNTMLFASSLCKPDLGTVADSSSSSCPLTPLLLALLLGSRASPTVGCISQVLVAGACVYVGGRMQGGSREKAAQGLHSLPEGPPGLYWATAQCFYSHSSCSITSLQSRSLQVLQAWGWKLLSARIRAPEH